MHGRLGVGGRGAEAWADGLGAAGLRMGVSSTLEALRVTAPESEYSTAPCVAQVAMPGAVFVPGVDAPGSAGANGVARRGRFAQAANGAGASGRAQPIGLSNAHICPHDSATSGAASDYTQDGDSLGASFECWIGANLAKVRLPGNGAQVGGGKRGVCGLMSRASQRRLRDRLNQVQLVALPLILTLTYPGLFPLDSRTWKRHKRAFGLRLKRAYPGAGWIWVLEYQIRGAPHFHMLVFGIPWLDREWLKRAWYEVVGSGDIRHYAAGTSVERVRSAERIVLTLSLIHI